MKRQRNLNVTKTVLSGALLLITVGNASAATGPEIAKRAFSSTVILLMEDANRQPVTIGSGFFVTDRHVATNVHVVKNAKYGWAKIVGDVKNVCENALCLAKWATDGMWYRAQIVKIDDSKKRINVFFIDFLSEEIVDVTDLKEMTPDFFNYPLKYILVTCDAMKNNADNSVEATIDKQLYAKVLCYSDDGVPEISIYDLDTDELLMKGKVFEEI